MKRGAPGPLLLGLLLLAAGGAPVPAEGAGYANPQLLVTTAELAGRLGDPSVRVVDVRRDETVYRAGHVPGAVYLPAEELDDPRANAEGWPIRPEKAAALLGGLGIDQETGVIAYDDAGGVLAARLFFVLEYFGHGKVHLLDGGLPKWRRERRPLETAVARVAPARFVARPRRELLATADEVRASLGKAEVCLLDARSPEEYAGTDVRARRGGRVPGAVNVEWVATLNPDGTFKAPDVLRAVFEAAGVRPDRQVIVYCQSGTRAAHDYFALRLLGYARIANYDGSWHEWGNDPSLPIAR